MRWSIIWLAAALLYHTPASAEGDPLNKSGNAFLTECGTGPHNFKCLGYVAGLRDGIDVAEMASRKETVCIPSEVTAGQMYDVIAAHIRANPANRHFPTPVLAYIALTQAFPCKSATK